MSVVIEQLKRAQRIDLDALGIKAVAIHGSQIVDLNKAQMRMGLDAKGDISPKYRSTYLRRKQQLPTYMAGTKVDLYLEGLFQGQMYMMIGNDFAEITSRDSKTPDLLEKYGEDIFNLNDEFKTQAHELTTPTFFKLAHDFLQGK